MIIFGKIDRTAITIKYSISESGILTANVPIENSASGAV